MRRLDNYYSAILAVLVLTSAVLTYLIISDQMTGELSSGSAVRDSSGVVNQAKDIKEVLAPTLLAVHEKNTSVRYTNNSTVVQQASEMLDRWDVDSLAQARQLESVKDFEELLRQDQWLELVYPTSVPFGDTTRYFNKVPKELVEHLYTRILIPIGDNEQQHVVFVDLQTHTYYTARKSDSPIADQLLALVRNNADAFTTGATVALKNNVAYLPIETVQLKKEVFLQEQQDVAAYAKAFYADFTQVRVGQSNHIVRYHNDLSELVYNKETGVLNFFQNIIDSPDLPFSEEVRASFNTLKRYESWRGQWNYFEWDAQTHDMTYRRYLNGFPIFSDKGVAKIRFNGNRESSVQVSLFTIQTPIESQQSDVVLPNVTTLRELLRAQNVRFEEIEELQIGYMWETRTEEVALVELTPQWYFKQGGLWQVVKQ